MFCHASKQFAIENQQSRFGGKKVMYENVRQP